MAIGKSKRIRVHVREYIVFTLINNFKYIRLSDRVKAASIQQKSADVEELKDVIKLMRTLILDGLTLFLWDLSNWE